MSILNTNERRAGPFAGNGTTVLVMSFPFLVYEAADVLVTAVDLTTNLQSTLVLGTDYIVVLNADQVSSPGCVVTTTAVVASTLALTLTSDLANTIDVQVAGAAAVPINRGFDRLAILIQQCVEWLSRCAVLPVGGIGSQSPSSLVFGVGLDGNGNPVPVLSQLASISTTAVSTFVGNLLTAANLAGFLNGLGLATFIKMFLQAGSAATAQTAIGLTPGVAAGNIVKLDGNARLPVVDGSQLTNLAIASGVRQCVISGDSITNQLAAGSGLAVGLSTAAFPQNMTIAFAYGYGSSGPVDFYTSLTNSQNPVPGWDSLPASSTVYLYADRNVSTGVISYGYTTLAPVYNLNGGISVANGQHTYVANDGVMFVGNGSTKTPVQRVFMGEAVTGVSSVTSVTTYACNGKYVSADTTWPAAGSAVSVNHNLGMVPMGSVRVEAVCQTAELGYAAGDVVLPYTTGNTYASGPLTAWKTRLTAGFTTGSAVSLVVLNKSSGVMSNATVGNWKYRVTLDRGF